MTQSRIAWSIAIVDMVGFVVVSLFVDPLPDYSTVVMYLVGVTSFVAVGAFLVGRVPTNPIGALLIAAGTIAVAGSALWAFANLGSAQIPPWPGATLARSVGDALFADPIVIALVWVPLVFPDGRLLSARFRWVVLASIVLMIAWAVGAIFESEVGGLTALLSMLVSFGGAAIAVSLRFRRGDPIQRQQVKGLAAAVVVAGVFFPVGFIVSIPYPFLSDALVGVALLALFALPVVIGIAILRYRLYEIDRIVSRSLSYAAVTGILFGVFAVVNLTLQAWLSPQLGGRGSIAIAASTLLVAALFNPLRGRVQRAVDRRFDRSRYDAERTVATLAATLRDEVDLEVLGAAITDVVARSVAPATTGLWLRPGSTR